jgi:hypothetical protein
LRNDGGGYHVTSQIVLSDAPHYIEVLVAYASSAVASDATLTIWIDGVQADQVTGIDLYDRSKPDTVLLGVVTVASGTSGTIYLDELVLRDDDTEIGEVVLSGGFPAAVVNHPRLGGVF